MIDLQHIRRDFPIFERQPGLVYLDSAATALKPRAVVEAMNRYYLEYSANVSRGLYPLAEGATTALEAARRTIARFVGAEREQAVVLTANATHTINLVALGLEENVTQQNNIVVTALEHHSNYLPWKELARRRGAELRVAPFTREGKVDRDALLSHVDHQTLLVAFSAVSNVFGTINPVAEIVRHIRAKYPAVLVLVDACQAAGHFPIDIKTWDADFIAFSGHKLFGPTGIGVLTGRYSSLARLRPSIVGGGTVLDACSRETAYKNLPDRLEGGTPNIAGAIGLGAAVEFVETIGLDHIREHEVALMKIALAKLRATFGQRLTLLGSSQAEERAGIVAFTLTGIHPHDLAHLLGELGVCVRAGEHCASPLHRSLDLPATTRISFSVYNNEQDIDALIGAMQKAVRILG